MKSKSTAAILAIFLGGGGVHRFYLGQTGLGFLYLIFFWTAIPAFVALIDFILFITTSEEKFNIKYNSKLSNPVNISSGSESNLDKLDKLFKLKEIGAISVDEYHKKRARLLQD